MYKEMQRAKNKMTMKKKLKDLQYQTLRLNKAIVIKIV